MMTAAKRFGGESVADQLAHVFVSLTTASTFPVIMAVYSAVLGFFVPSRQMDYRGALCDAVGQRSESASRLGGAGLQRGRSPAEPDKSVLDVAASGCASVVSHAMIYNMIRVCYAGWHVDEPRGIGDHA
jgi:hypothetical protein